MGPIIVKKDIPKDLENIYMEFSIWFNKLNIIEKSVYCTKKCKNKKCILDLKYDRYNKKFYKKFGRNAYIAEPSGSKEQTIMAIKTCLKENKDILDELLYPNFDKNVFY